MKYLAISESSRGLGLVARLERQKNRAEDWVYFEMLYEYISLCYKNTLMYKLCQN
jgi:hypothetical protein